MITTVTLNPCIDKLVEIDSFCEGGLNRIQSSRFDMSGKGINVSKVLIAHDIDTICTGFMYKENKYLYDDDLAEKNIKHDFWVVDGRVRTNTKVYNKEKQQVTELNEPGMPVKEKDIENLFKKIIKLAKNSDYIVLGGSMPQGVNSDFYYDIAKAAKEYTKVILDADGKNLSIGIEAIPYMIKPNEHELELLINKKIKTQKDIMKAANIMLDKGIKVVAVTLGDKGAYLFTKKGAWYTPPVKGIDVLGTAGAGDSFIAGFLYAKTKQYDDKKCLKYAAACATASIQKPGTILANITETEYNLSKIEVETL